MKKTRHFRFSDETVRKLDAIVKFENDSLEKIGILGFEYNRTSVLEQLIDCAYRVMKQGRSFQDVLIVEGDGGK